MHMGTALNKILKDLEFIGKGRARSRLSSPREQANARLRRAGQAPDRLKRPSFKSAEAKGQKILASVAERFADLQRNSMLYVTHV